jgi:hypothetical protein
MPGLNVKPGVQRLLAHLRERLANFGPELYEG